MVILIIFTIVFILLKIFFSINIKLEIEDLKIAIQRIRKKITNNDSKVSLKFYILKKVKIAEINLKKIDLKDEKVKNRLQKQFEGNKFNLDTIKFLKNVNYIFEKLNLKIYIGVEDAALTAISTGTIHGVISNFLRGKVKNIKYIKYEVNPIYQGKNILKIEIDSIITLKMEKIIDIIRFMKKGRVKKNGRSSNRRSYAYSNE